MFQLTWTLEVLLVVEMLEIVGATLSRVTGLPLVLNEIFEEVAVFPARSLERTIK